MADPDRLPISTPEKQGRRVTWLGLYVSLLLIALKAAAGIWGNSRALLADAVHSASDLVSDILVLVGFTLGRRPADAGHPWGHGRVETLSSALVGVSLLGAGLAIVWDAASQFFIGAGPRPGWLAIAAAGPQRAEQRGALPLYQIGGPKTEQPLA